MTTSTKILWDGLARPSILGSLRSQLTTLCFSRVGASEKVGIPSGNFLQCYTMLHIAMENRHL